MRKIFPVFLFFLAVLLAGCARNKEVYGTLTQVNGDPAADVKLTLCLNNKVDGTCDINRNIRFETTTTKDGSFKFVNIPDGKYYILFTPPDFPSELVPLLDFAGEPIKVEMLDGKPVNLQKLILRTSWAI